MSESAGKWIHDIVFLCVGAERDVSLKSGQSLADALESVGQVDLIDLVETKLPLNWTPVPGLFFQLFMGLLVRMVPCKHSWRRLICLCRLRFKSSRLCMHKGKLRI